MGDEGWRVGRGVGEGVEGGRHEGGWSPPTNNPNPPPPRKKGNEAETERKGRKGKSKNMVGGEEEGGEWSTGVGEGG